MTHSEIHISWVSLFKGNSGRTLIPAEKRRFCLFISVSQRLSASKMSFGVNSHRAHGVAGMTGWRRSTRGKSLTSKA
jgi:hypothetical protein